MFVKKLKEKKLIRCLYHLIHWKLQHCHRRIKRRSFKDSEVLEIGKTEQNIYSIWMLTQQTLILSQEHYKVRMNFSKNYLTSKLLERNLHLNSKIDLRSNKFRRITHNSTLQLYLLSHKRFLRMYSKSKQDWILEKWVKLFENTVPNHQ